MRARPLISGMAGCWALAVLALSNAVSSAEPVSFFGLAFPDQIGGARRVTTHDFEGTNPGLGYSGKYEAPGWTVDVFIYDLRASPISAEVTSEPVRGQLLQATNDVLKRRNATDIKIVLRYALLDDRGGVRFLCTSFKYKDRNNPVDSYLCVTSSKNRFVKFRLTSGEKSGSEIWANGFVQSWTPLLWP